MSASYSLGRAPVWAGSTTLRVSVVEALYRTSDAARNLDPKDTRTWRSGWVFLGLALEAEATPALIWKAPRASVVASPSGTSPPTFLSTSMTLRPLTAGLSGLETTPVTVYIRPPAPPPSGWSASPDRRRIAATRALRGFRCFSAATGCFESGPRRAANVGGSAFPV